MSKRYPQIYPGFGTEWCQRWNCSQVQTRTRTFLAFFHLVSLTSQEHCTNQVTGFPIRKLIPISLITFFGNFAAFFGNNFLLLQRFLIRGLLLDEVILPSRQPRNTELKCQNRGMTELFLKKTGDFSIKNLNILSLPV